MGEVLYTDEEDHVVQLHVHCPCCEYDLFGSVQGKCPECGLANGGSLLDEYAAGRRPAPVECTCTSWPLLAALQTAMSGRTMVNLARGFPERAAQLFCKRVFWLAVVVFVILAVTTKSFKYANNGNLFVGYPGVTRSDGQEYLKTPSVSDCLDALCWLPVYLGSVIPALIVVRRRSTRMIRHHLRLSQGDAIRMFAFSSAWLAMLFNCWDVSLLSSVALKKLGAPIVICLAVRLMIIIIGVYGWPKSLRQAGESYVSLALEDRIGRNLAERIRMEAVLIILGCYLISMFVFIAILQGIGAVDFLVHLSR